LNYEQTYFNCRNLLRLSKKYFMFGLPLIAIPINFCLAQGVLDGRSNEDYMCVVNGGLQKSDGSTLSSLLRNFAFDDEIKKYNGAAWVLAYEANEAHDRKRAGLAASRLQSVVYAAKDHSGTLYHFWTYFLHNLLGKPATRSQLDWFSWGHERVAQGDLGERSADMLSLELVIEGRQKCNGP